MMDSRMLHLKFYFAGKSNHFKPILKKTEKVYFKYNFLKETFNFLKIKKLPVYPGSFNQDIM
jgi:hypothetical protein